MVARMFGFVVVKVSVKRIIKNKRKAIKKNILEGKPNFIL
ncbi:MAG: hypothetical protein ACI8ZO_001103 [Flavobacteriales bacterium]|jgi:hypothetical protein